MAKYRRQPKAGDLATRGSARFAKEPREIAAATPLYIPRTENRENTDISQWKHKVQFIDEGRAYGSNIWRKTGGMSGGKNGACQGVTSGNGIKIVPAAFHR
jgi:hypothetical protein